MIIPWCSLRNLFLGKTWDISPSLGCNWPFVLEKRAFKFSLFRHCLSLEKGVNLIWTIPFTQEYFATSFVEIDPLVLEKIFKFCQVFLLSFPKELPKMHCAKFGWNWRSGSGEEIVNVKSLQTNRQTDDGRQVIRKAEHRGFVRVFLDMYFILFSANWFRNYTRFWITLFN